MEANAKRAPRAASVKRAYDACVVGTQLGGVAAAALLARRGFRVLLVDSDGRGSGYEEAGWRLPWGPALLPVPKAVPAAEQVLGELGLASDAGRLLEPARHPLAAAPAAPPARPPPLARRPGNGAPPGMARRRPEAGGGARRGPRPLRPRATPSWPRSPPCLRAGCSTAGDFTAREAWSPAGPGAAPFRSPSSATTRSPRHCGAPGRSSPRSTATPPRSGWPGRSAPSSRGRCGRPEERPRSRPCFAAASPSRAASSSAARASPRRSRGWRWRAAAWWHSG